MSNFYEQIIQSVKTMHIIIIAVIFVISISLIAENEFGGSELIIAISLIVAATILRYAIIEATKFFGKSYK